MRDISTLEGGGGMRGKLFKLAARVSTVLCVAALALSLRSHWRADRLRYAGPSWTGSLTSDDGSVRASFAAARRPDRPGTGWSLTSDPASRTSVGADGTAFDSFGHRVSRFPRPGGGGVEVRRWWAPHWAFILAFAILPAVYAVRRRLALQREDFPRCPACGHELSGTPERCPACGAVIVEEAE
jgi:hypothetical protein